MQLEHGWLADARRVPSPHHDCRPEDEIPSLLVVHNISLPPGEFGGPWIDALFTGTIDPDAHPFLRRSLTCAFLLIVLFVVTAKSSSMFPLINVPGMRAFLSIRGVNGAMTFLSASSWKGLIHCPTPMRSINSWPR